MDVDALIDTYVQDVVQLLPRRQRDDVALELRGLVHEELQSRAASRGHALGAEIALDGLRAFGRPQEVAARYYEPWTIIPPTETRRCVFAAVVGAAVLVALSPLGSAPPQPAQLGVAILAWLGLLAAYFGIQSLAQRRSGAAKPWTPRAHDSVSRVGSLALIALIGVGMLAYGAPGWIYSQFTHGQTLSARLDYDPAFHATRLPVLFALWGCQAILLVVLAARARWTPLLRRVDAWLEIGVALVLVWFVVAGRVFRESALNSAALNLISVVILLLAIDVGVKFYRGSRRMPGAAEAHTGTQ